MGGEWEVSDESRRERERGRGRGTRQIEEPPPGPPPTVEEEQGKWCNGGVVGAQSSAGQASLVRVETKTGSRGKYKAEPATGGGGEGQGALVVQPARKLLQQVICTPTSNTAGQKLSWLLRGGNCTLLRTDSLFAVVGCDCHTGCRCIQRRPGDAEKVPKGMHRRQKCHSHKECQRMGWSTHRPLLLCNLRRVCRKLRFLSFTDKPPSSAGMLAVGRKKDAI